MGIFRANPEGRVFPGGCPCCAAGEGSAIPCAARLAMHPGKPVPPLRGVFQQPVKEGLNQRLRGRMAALGGRRFAGQ